MKKYFTSMSLRRLLMIVALGFVSVFVLISPQVFAAMTLNTNTISTTGALNLNPTGQPVTVNGDFSVTGTCIGCGSQVYNVKAYGAVGDGTTDDSTAVIAAIAATSTAGGGVVYFPKGTYRIDSQIVLPNNGGTPPTQKALRFTGDGALFSGQGGAPNGGSILDLRSTTGPAKIDTRGLGLLEIDRLTLEDSTDGTNAFIQTTNTTLHINHAAFYGKTSGVTAAQDAIVLGSTTTTLDGSSTAAFQGYGTVIDTNYFGRIRRGVYARTYANGVVIINNTWWNSCGGVAAIESDGLNDNNGGLYIGGNLIEESNYTYAMKFTKTNTSSIIGNNLYDTTATTTAHYRFEAGAIYNTVIAGFHSDATPAYTEDAAAADTNTFLNGHQSQVTKWAQPAIFSNVDPGVTFSGPAIFTKPSSVLFQPATATGDGTAVFTIKRSAAESLNPGVISTDITQGGALILSGTNAGTINFNNQAGALISGFSQGGKTWSLAGAGGAMEINSGTGGSYLTLQHYALKLKDQAGANEVRIKSGSGSPEGALAFPVGSIYFRTDGGTGTTFYVKETGAATNTGWVAK